MQTVIIDYDSGNLHSARKAFAHVARDIDAGDVIVTGDPDIIAQADRIVLPGDGAFPACQRALMQDRAALFESMCHAVETNGRPFLGICVGMQLMAKRGFEYKQTPGLGWIDGEVYPITPSSIKLKVPHMGWNDLIVTAHHPVLAGIETGAHAYFIHSYQMELDTPAQRLAFCDYGGDITALVAQDTMVGAQFHPEKSHETGLRLIANFLSWRP